MVICLVWNLKYRAVVWKQKRIWTNIWYYIHSFTVWATSRVGIFNKTITSWLRKADYGFRLYSQAVTLPPVVTFSIMIINQVCHTEKVNKLCMQVSLSSINRSFRDTLLITRWTTFMSFSYIMFNSRNKLFVWGSLHSILVNNTY